MTEFAEALILTTPNIHGQKVSDAQWLLSGHNVFKDDKHPVHTYDGDIDGIYGPVTATAAKRAKWELGFPSTGVTNTFGQVIYNILEGKTKLPIDYLHHRSDRMAQSNKARAVDIALGQVGYIEQPPGSNRTKYGEWYGYNGVPWCAIFVSWCLHEAGFRTPDEHAWRYAYVPFIVEDAARGIHGMQLTKTPIKGDLACYTINGHPNAHVGFFESKNDESTFHDVAGNTGFTNQSAGGEVLKQIQHYHSVTHFVRLP